MPHCRPSDVRAATRARDVGSCMKEHAEGGGGRAEHAADDGEAVRACAGAMRAGSSVVGCPHRRRRRPVRGGAQRVWIDSCPQGAPPGTMDADVPRGRGSDGVIARRGCTVESTMGLPWSGHPERRRGGRGHSTRAAHNALARRSPIRYVVFVREARGLAPCAR